MDAILQEMERIRKERDKSDWPTEMKQAVNRNLPDFLTTSYALYQQLFPNAIQQRLAEIKPTTLYIVPTRALYELPFDALVTTQNQEQYLLHQYATSYLSSASLLKTLRDPQPGDTASTRQPLLAFANPVYSSTACQKEAQEETGAGLRECFIEIPDTGYEAAKIADTLQANLNWQPAPLQFGEQASKQTVLKLNDQGNLDDFQYVLFATHGILPGEVTNLVQPALVLSHPEQDGYLTMGEVFGLKFNADLVTLSACNTGRGQLTNGEGVIGLTRAFMYAGTPAVAMTLWSIESKASTALTTRWFKRLKEKQHPLPEALRQTKLELLTKDPSYSIPQYYRHPYFWSGWVVFGVEAQPKH